MHILIFGKNGQLGSELVALCEKQGISCAAVGREECDITKREEVQNIIASESPTHVINAAAHTLVDLAETEQQALAHAVNAEAPGHMTEAAKGCSAYMMHVSTDYVFDGELNRPYTEEDSPNPQNIYGATKLEGERQVLAYEKGSVFRVSWLYGNGMSFVKKVEAFAKDNDELMGVFDEVSIPTPAFWLAEILLKAAHAKLTGLYHAVPRGETSRVEWVREIARQRGIEKPIKEVPLSTWKQPAKRLHYTAMSSRKLEHALGESFPAWQELLEQYFLSE